MSLFNRITTWAAAQILKASDLNGEFNNLVNGLNNLDAASTSWTNVKVGTFLSTASTTLKGSATNDSAAAGNVGEYILGDQSSATSAGTSAQFSDLTSIALTAGDWDVIGRLVYFKNGATISAIEGFIGTTAGNNSTGLTDSTRMSADPPATAIVSSTTFLRASLTGNTTYYLKYEITYSAGTPQVAGRISARRAR